MKSNRFKIFVLGTGLVVMTLLALGVIVSTDQAGAAPAAAMLWLDPVEAVGVTGSSTSVDVELSDIVGVFGIEFSISFDPSIVTVVDGNPSIAGVQVAPGTCPAPDFVVPSEGVDNTAGTIDYAATSLSPSVPCDGGTAATIEFLCADGLLEEVTTPITITHSLVPNIGGDPIPHSTQNGAVRCEANIFFIDGIVELQGWSPPSGVQVDLKDVAGATLDSVNVGADGTFGFTGTAGEVYSVEASYDRYLGISVDGITTSTIGEHVDIGTGVLPAGDFNGDGIINILDLTGVAGNFNKTTFQTWAP